MDPAKQQRVDAAYQAIVDLYTNYGQSDYIGESINQVEHALQAAYFAARAGARSYAVLAALLHDAGHLIGQRDHKSTMGNLGIQNHEGLGAEFVRQIGLNEKVAELISSHVLAKRYLCYVNPEYYNKLSAASLGTLQRQGGPMTATEAAAFELNPLKKEIILMRTWDEAAKVVGMKVPSLEAYKSVIADNLA